MATDTPGAVADDTKASGTDTRVADDGESGGDPDGTDAPHPAFAPYAAESLPAAAVGAPGKDGRLELRFGTDAGGETALVWDLARTPFHVSGTLGHDPLDRAETVYVQSPSGGVVQGDRHTVEVEVRSDAVAHVSTASATKVLSMERNYAAADVSLSVGAGAHLDYVPGPTILHAGARYAQSVTVDLDPAGSAVVGDVVVPGRLARGERFDFERYLSRVRVHSGGDLLVADATHLRPGDADPTAPGALGEFAVLGTLYVLAPAADTDDLSDRLHAVAADGDDDETSGEDAKTEAGESAQTVRAGASALPNGAGVAVRALGHRSETVTAALWNAWDEARRDLLGVGAPDARGR